MWTLSNSDHILQRWIRLLNPGGRLLLMEGFWYTNVGLQAQQILDAVPESVANVFVQPLNTQAALWGQFVSDERYAVVADRHSERRSSKLAGYDSQLAAYDGGE